jgi:alpha-galactosidase
MAKIVGKSSGWTGPVEKYTKNKGSVGRKKIVFIGASYQFVHKVLRDMLLVGGFNECEVVVHDLLPEPIKMVGDLLERMARQAKSKITVTRSLDRREALKGADAAILSITTGGKEADFRTTEVCAKYGVTVGVVDTLGPTALARNLRNIPVVTEMIRDMEDVCPDALMLNFTNPMSALTGAMARRGSIPCWGLCHSADSLFQYFSEVFRVPRTQVQMEIGGVNHQAFVTKLFIRGKDRTSDILNATLESHAKFKDTILSTREEEVVLQQDIFKILGAWPSCGDTHLAEFYRFFYTPRRISALSHELQKVIPGRAQFGPKNPPQILLDWAYGPEGVGDMHLITSEHAHELLWSNFTKEPFSRILNLLNTGGYITGLPKDACIEAMVTVAGKKVTGKPVTLPTAVQALVHNWVSIHDLSIRAALECDRDLARQALFLDPHVQDMYDIPPMLEDLIQATKPWMPAKWYK